MEEKIRSQYSSEVLDEAVRRFEIPPESVRDLGGFESFVYECQHHGKPRILRITHCLHRDIGQICAEIDWISYLAENGVGVCAPVFSNERYSEMIGPDDSYFVATLFEKAVGQPARDGLWAPPVFEKMGRMMGQMHALTKRYKPPHEIFRRPHWDKDVEGIAQKYLPADQTLVAEKFESLAAEIRQLPRDEDTYGLVHIDFHRGNFLVDGDQIHLFDFDDCQYSWFADDIAIALFYAVPYICESAKDLEFAREFLRRFLDGYHQENDLDSE
ncbi:MAG: phosphotransferase, partial [Verrucomicrobiota bacterium]